MKTSLNDMEVNPPRLFCTAPVPTVTGLLPPGPLPSLPWSQIGLPAPPPHPPLWQEWRGQGHLLLGARGLQGLESNFSVGGRKREPECPGRCWGLTALLAPPSDSVSLTLQGQPLKKPSGGLAHGQKTSRARWVWEHWCWLELGFVCFAFVGSRQVNESSTADCNPTPELASQHGNTFCCVAPDAFIPGNIQQGSLI